MSSYTDDEIRDVLQQAAVNVWTNPDAPKILRWLASEYPRLKADAERLDWIEAKEPIIGNPPKKGGEWMVVPDGREEAEFYGTFRAAIDAARGKEGK